MHSSAAPVKLSSRGFVDHHEDGLYSAVGAQKVISTIASRKSVTKLILGNNKLGDDGCIALFHYLSTPEGRKHPVAEISLNANCIGNRGLLAVAGYLKDNTTLKELFLQNNAFTPEPTTIMAFTDALNTSHLSSLYITTNTSLSDDFVAQLLPNLTTPYLHELHLSTLNLTSASGPKIADFIASKHCHLRTLKLNGNSLGLSSVKKIVDAIHRRNYELRTVEIHSNKLSEDTAEEDGPALDPEGQFPLEKWKVVDKELRVALFRNETLRARTERDALCLLRHARPILLRSKASRSTTHQESACSVELEASTTSASKPEEVPFSSKSALPAELVQYILSLLAPSLSPAQLIRVFQYASSPDTLPSLALPRLSGSSKRVKRPRGTTWEITNPLACLPDPTLSFGAPSGGCSGGVCMGNSVNCRRNGERTKWLEAIGCNVYDPS